MKRYVYDLMATLVLASLLLAACAPAAPAPTPTPAAKPATEAAPTPAPKPPAEATSAPAATASPAAKPASTTGAPAKTYNWKLVSSFPPGHNQNRSLLEIAKTLEERTNGAVRITVYESTLGAPGDFWEMAKSNTVQLAFVGEGFNLSRMPITAMVCLPFELPDMKAVSLVTNEWLKAGYLRELTDNFKVLYFQPTPLLHIFPRDKKVTRMEDLKGMKLRVFGGVQGQVLAALGATGVTVPAADVYMALDRGTVDGTLTGADNVIDRKFYEVVKYGLKLPLTTGTFALVMNKETWNGLSPDLQKTIEQIGQDISSAELKRLIDEEQSLWDTLGKKIEVYTISPEEQKRWRDAVMAAGIADKYVQETAAKGYPAKEALDLMRKVVSDYKK